ncbi:OS9 protein, partial [Corythaixoides concolor]|nr:OS9 protein [Corythaixoides concolor]
VRAALDLQELSELKYGLEILAEPVLAGQHRAEDVVTVASKFKQRYECRLPPAALQRPPEPGEEAQLYNGSGVAELLHPMGAAPCLVKVPRASKQHRLKRYHSQSYVNGSRCDLTGRAREAEVRFLCEEGAGDYIARVDEPQSCSYVLTVHTTRICHHPFLRPPAGAAPQPIRCQPALSPAQYVEYVRAQVSDTKRKVEEISEELKTLDTRLWSERDAESLVARGDGTARGDAAPRDEPDPTKETAFWERERREVSGEAEGQRDGARVSPRRRPHPRKKIHFKVIRSPGDLLQFIEELKESTKKVGGHPGPTHGASPCLSFPPGHRGMFTGAIALPPGQGEGERGGGGGG